MVPTTRLSKKFKPSLGLDLIDSQSSYCTFYACRNMQNAPGTAGIAGPSKICSTYFTATANAVVSNTVCTFTTPFKIGVHFDGDESHWLALSPNMFEKTENSAIYTAGSGAGWSGFYFDYWQNTC